MIRHSHSVSLVADLVSVGLEFRFELGRCDMDVQIDWSLGTG